MQVYKTFLKIALRNISSSIMYFAIFTSLAFIIPKAQGSKSVISYSSEKVSVGIVDRDNTDISKALYGFVDEHHNIKELLPDEEAWADDLFYHNVDYILVIEKGFSEKLASGDYEAMLTAYQSPTSNSSYIVNNQVESFLGNLSLFLKNDMSLSEATAQATEIAAVEASVVLPDNSDAHVTNSPISMFFTFVPYIMICILINSLGPSLIIWNRPEIRTRTEISSLPALKRNMGMIAAVATFAMVIFGIFMSIASNAFKKDFFAKVGLYYTLNTFVYLLVCLALTYLIAQFTKKLQMLSVWSNVIGLSTSFLCGVFVGRALLPDKVVSFSRCLPTYWYINVTEELRSFSGTLSANAYRSMGVQLLFAVAIFAIAMAVIEFKRRPVK